LLEAEVLLVMGEYLLAGVEREAIVRLLQVSLLEEVQSQNHRYSFL
jgi:hypothetical protein